MRTSLAILALVLVCAMASMASASVASFTFNANDWFNITPTPQPGDTIVTQLNARDLNIQNSDDSATLADYNTYTTTDSLNSYTAWTSTLTAGYGISTFSLWLEPQWGYGATFGENLGLYPNGGTGGSNSCVISVTGPAGWTGSVVTAWGAYPGIITWTTSDPSLYIRPGSSLGNFSFTADVAVEDSGGNLVSDVLDGTAYRVFFWADSEGGTGLSPNSDIVFNPADPVYQNYVSVGDDVQFFAFQNITAEAVPEPATLSLLALGGLALLRRRRATK